MTLWPRTKFMSLLQRVYVCTFINIYFKFSACKLCTKCYSRCFSSGTKQKAASRQFFLWLPASWISLFIMHAAGPEVKFAFAFYPWLSGWLVPSRWQHKTTAPFCAQRRNLVSFKVAWDKSWHWWCRRAQNARSENGTSFKTCLILTAQSWPLSFPPAKKSHGKVSFP